MLRWNAGNDVVHWPGHVAQTGVDTELADVSSLKIDGIYGTFEPGAERCLKVDLIEPGPMRIG